MKKNIKIRKKKTRKIILLLIVLFLVLIGIVIYINKDNDTKSEYELALEKELKEVNSLANKAWSKSYSSGKKEENEIKEYILSYLKNSNIDTDKYYLTITSKGVEISKKHTGLLVKAGYYKSGTNYTQIVNDWQSLINTRGINVVEGRLGLLRKVEDKVDVVIDKSVIEIKDRVIEKELKIGTISIPNTIETISNTAFKDAHIEEIILDAKLQQLDGHFNGLYTLKKITFTGNTNIVRGKTFYDTNIEEVNFIGTIEQLVAIRYLTYFDVPSYDKKCKLYVNGIEINEIVVPEGVERIEDFALHNYTNITKITIPESVKYIGTAAFTGSGIKEVIYNGTKDMWEKIVKMEEWHFGGISCIVSCIDGQIIYEMEDV